MKTWNAVLIRYAGGHTYVDRANGGVRRETYIEMAQVTDRQQARQLGAQFLAIMGESSTTTTAQGVTRSFEAVPGAGFRLLDKVGGALVNGMGFTLTDSGGAQVNLELGDQRQQALDALARQVQRAGLGTTSEMAAPRTNTPAEGGGSDSMPPPFSHSGDRMSTRLSPPWPCPSPFMLSWIELEVKSAGWASTRAIVVMEPKTGPNVQLGSVTLDGGDKRAVATIGKMVMPGQMLYFGFSREGGVKDATLTPRGAFV